MVEIFKTNVPDPLQADQLVTLLYRYFPGCRINFDLEDCDRILRVEGELLTTEKVKMLVNERGFICEVLD